MQCSSYYMYLKYSIIILCPVESIYCFNFVPFDFPLVNKHDKYVCTHVVLFLLLFVVSHSLYSDDIVLVPETNYKCI